MIRFCDSCKSYSLRKKCLKCGKGTSEKRYKFRFKWLK